MMCKVDAANCIRAIPEKGGGGEEMPRQFCLHIILVATMAPPILTAVMVTPHFKFRYSKGT